MQRLTLTAQTYTTVVSEAVKTLRSGGLVVFPTETTYGAGVDACNQAAVDKLLRYKSRREGKPLSIAVTDLDMAECYVEVNEQAHTLYRQFLPGPVTVVSQGRGVVASGVESEFGTLGVRIPDYPLVLDLVRTLGRPITATSANGSGQKRPYTIADILTRLSAKQQELIDLVIDAGQLPNRPPSTVIDTTLAAPVTLRQGSVTIPSAGDPTGAGAPLHSRTEAETKRLAGLVLLKHWDQLQHGPIVLALDGPLGAGKTVFAKGVAEFLGITEPIVSPTYTYIEEYDFVRHQTAGRLFHLDMWKVDSAAQCQRLELGTLLLPNTVIIIEWWQQVAAYLLPVLTAQQVEPIICRLSDVTNGEGRQITVSE